MQEKTCKLIIKDFVNVKFEGLDPTVRRTLSNTLKWMVPYARHTPSFKLGRWDGKVSFCTVGGATYINMLERALPIVIDAGYEIEIEDHRLDHVFNFPEISEDMLADRCWPEGHTMAGEPIMLRDYQVESIKLYLNNLQSIQSISTGAGKCCDYNTFIGIEIDHSNDFSNFFINEESKSPLGISSEFSVKMGALCDAISQYRSRELIYNAHIPCSDLGIRISTPEGKMVPVRAVVRKRSTGVKIGFSDGHSLVCADGHLLLRNMEIVSAKDLKAGEKITTSHGLLAIDEITMVPEQDFYDVAVDHPHLYVDAAGIVHHNTLLTATLSLLCEPFGRTIVIVPSTNLVEQTEEDYRNIGLDVGVFYGQRKEYGHKHTICTWQSLSVFAKKEKREIDFSTIIDPEGLNKFLEGVVCVMVDEAHTVKGNELRSLLCGPMAHIPIRWGLTGTVPTEDWEFMNLLVGVGPVVGEIRAADLQEQGVLAGCHVSVMKLIDDHVEFSAYDEEYNYLTSDKVRLKWIAEYCANLADSGNTLILVDRIECGEFLKNHIPESVFINGKIKTKDRRKEYKDVQIANNKIIIATYGVAAVGINIPRIFNLVLLEPGKSFVRVIQSIGRGIRKAADKDFVNIVDFCSSLKFSSRHLSKRKIFYKTADYNFDIKKVKYR